MTLNQSAISRRLIDDRSPTSRRLVADRSQRYFSQRLVADRSAIGRRLVGDHLATYATSSRSNSVAASLLCMFKRQPATDFNRRLVGNFKNHFRDLCNRSAISVFVLVANQSRTGCRDAFTYPFTYNVILNKKGLSQRIPFRRNKLPFLPWLILHISFSNSNAQSHHGKFPMHNNRFLFIQV